MKLKIGSKVLVGSAKVEGLVVDIEKTTGSLLVEHLIVVDGKSKTVKQWYSENTTTEVVSEVELNNVVKDISAATVKSGKKIGKALKKIELGIIPQKSDSDGE